MGIYYTCRHCNTCLGVIPKKLVQMEQLGLHLLTTEELQQVMISDSMGNVHIRIICEDCEEAFQHNPSFHGIDYIIQ
ncbi:MAG: anti-sigma-F factor Fin [Bacillus sp. (in: firmicutes)]